MRKEIRARLEISDEELADFCRRRNILELSLFGSILRDDFGPDSDIDLLVKYGPAPRRSLVDHIKIENEPVRPFGPESGLVQQGRGGIQQKLDDTGQYPGFSRIDFMNRDRGWLIQIVGEASLVLTLTRGFDRNSFLEDIRTQLAVRHQIMVIGETVKRLSDSFRAAHPEIPWSEIAGMRDRLIHEYDNVDRDMVWDAGGTRRTHSSGVSQKYIV